MTSLDTGCRRRSVRLCGYDYSQPGAYFVTICAFRRRCVFGDVRDGTVHLNALGMIARHEWFKAADIRAAVSLHPDEFVMMPNHLHGIIRLVTPAGVAPAGRRAGSTCERFGKPVKGSVPSIVRAFKAMATRRINAIRETPAADVWQANYYEHIVRDESTLTRLRQYIAENPFRWDEDEENPDRMVR